MANVKVEIIGAYVNGQGPGSILTTDEQTANYLERVGYGKKLVEVESTKEEPKADAVEEKPKAPRKRTTTKKD